jgi:hypothetical protein
VREATQYALSAGDRELAAGLVVQGSCDALNRDNRPTLSPYNLEALQINKDLMLSHGYIEHDFDVFEWAAPEFLEKAAAELLEATLAAIVVVAVYGMFK